MPQVPKSEGEPQFQTGGLPGIQYPYRGEFGRMGASVEKLSQGIDKASMTISEISSEVQRQHDIATSSIGHAQGVLDEADEVEKAKLSSPDGLVHDPITGETQDYNGHPMTIADQYAQNADQRYQAWQIGKTPGAKEMFAAKMQPQLTNNTLILRNYGLSLQAEFAKNAGSVVADTVGRDFHTKFVPDEMPYYSGPATPSKLEGPVGSGGPEDQTGVNDLVGKQGAPAQGTGGPQDLSGGTKQWPSQQKFLAGLARIQQTVQQLGPVQGKLGSMGQPEVDVQKKILTARTTWEWFMSGMDDLTNAQGSRQALHQQAKDASSTAFMQLHSMSDIVNGKDPESMANQAAGRPSWNSSATPEQIIKANQIIQERIPATREVDKAEYNMLIGQNLMNAHNVKDLDAFEHSGLLQRQIMAGNALGIPPAEQVEKMAPILAAMYHSKMENDLGRISSTAQQTAYMGRMMQDLKIRTPRIYAAMGYTNSAEMGQALGNKVLPEFANKIAANDAAIKKDPMGYAGGYVPGVVNSQGMPETRNPVRRGLEDRLAQSQSAMELFKPASPGSNSTVWETLQKNANLDGGTMLVHGTAPNLSNAAFENQAKLVKNLKDPAMISEYFKALGNQRGSDAEKENFQTALVEQGKLPQTYLDVLNLETPAEREASWARLGAGAAPIPAGFNDPKGTQLNADAVSHSEAIARFLNVKYGVNATIARRTLQVYQNSWKESVKQAGAPGRDMSYADAMDFADHEREVTTGDVGNVGARAHFPVIGFDIGSSGPQVPLEFGRPTRPGPPTFSDEEKKNIQDMLLYAQTDGLKLMKIAPVPGALPANPNANPSTSGEDFAGVKPSGNLATDKAAADKAAAIRGQREFYASRPAIWKRADGGYRIFVNETNDTGRLTGRNVPMQVVGTDGKNHYVDVTEAAALAGRPKTAPGTQ